MKRWLAYTSKTRRVSILFFVIVLWFASAVFVDRVFSQGNSRRSHLEVEIVTIRGTGFEPKIITRPAGKFVLTIENRSGVDEVSLRLDQQGGNRLKDLKVKKNVLDWADVLDLRAGDYFLTEANHTNWSCHIKITAP